MIVNVKKKNIHWNMVLKKHKKRCLFFCLYIFVLFLYFVYICEPSYGFLYINLDKIPIISYIFMSSIHIIFEVYPPRLPVVSQHSSQPPHSSSIIEIQFSKCSFSRWVFVIPHVQIYFLSSWRYIPNRFAWCSLDSLNPIYSGYSDEWVLSVFSITGRSTEDRISFREARRGSSVWWCVVFRNCLWYCLWCHVMLHPVRVRRARITRLDPGSRCPKFKWYGRFTLPYAFQCSEDVLVCSWI